MLVANYSQIELRVLAHMSGDELLLDAFARDADIHTETAAKIFGANPEDVTTAQRRMAKVVNFGVVYGLSLIHISEPTRLGMISYAVFCLQKKKKQGQRPPDRLRCNVDRRAKRRRKRRR